MLVEIPLWSRVCIGFPHRFLAVPGLLVCNGHLVNDARRQPRHRDSSKQAATQGNDTRRRRRLFLLPFTFAKVSRLSGERHVSVGFVETICDG